MDFTKLIMEAAMTKTVTLVTLMDNHIKYDSIQANTTKYRNVPYFNRFHAWPFSDEKVCVVNPVVCNNKKLIELGPPLSPEAIKINLQIFR